MDWSYDPGHPFDPARSYARPLAAQPQRSNFRTRSGGVISLTTKPPYSGYVYAYDPVLDQAYYTLDGYWDWAVEDAGGSVLGKPVEIVFADHQNKADIGAAVARRWFEDENVDMAIGFDNSSVALAVEQLAASHNKIAIAGAVGSTAFTGKNCNANEASWIYDSYALTTSLAKSTVAEGRDTWFFITVDYAFGHSLEADATAAVQAAGGKVLGSVRHPLNTSDFSSYLLQAQSSGAEVVALANSSGDTMTALKQAAEYGITASGQRIAGMLLFISDVHAVGLETAQGLTLTTGFYWDLDDQTRAWSKRFGERMNGKMPTMVHAGVYSSVTHYLQAVKDSGTDEPLKVAAKMREKPIEDFFSRDGKLREDGLMVHDLVLVQVKTPEESKAPWDYYKILATIKGEDAFGPPDPACTIGKK